MPRTRSLAYSELKVGIVAMIALLLAATVIFMLSREGGFFWQRYHLKTRFDEVPGLKPGALVRLAGIEVGTVSAVQLMGSQVEVLFELSRTYQPQITDRSHAALGSLSLLGQATVDVTAAPGGRPVAEWGYIPSIRVSQLSAVATTANESLEQATRLMEDLRAGKGTAGRLLTDDSLFLEMRQLVSAAGAVANNLSRGRGTVGRLINDPAAGRALEASLRNLETITARISAGEGSLGRLLNDDRFERALTSATSNVDALTQRLGRGEGTAGKLMTDATLYDRLTTLADRLDQVAQGLAQGRGTVGLLLHDRQLYDNMNGTVGELRLLIAAIRKDPRKYLTLKVTLF